MTSDLFIKTREVASLPLVLLDRALDGYFVVSAQGVIQYANPSLHKLVGAQHDLLVGKHVGDFFSSLILPQDSRIDSNEILPPQRVQLRTIDGQLEAEVNISSYGGSENQSFLGLVTSKPQVSAEDKRALELSCLDRVFTNMGVVLGKMSLDWKFDYLSANKGSFFGTSGENYEEHFAQVRERIHPEDRDIAFEVPAYPNERFVRASFRYINPDGSIRYLCSYRSVYTDQQTQQPKIIALIMDETELMMAKKKLHDQERELLGRNQQLLQINRDLEEFTYAAYHDMSQPLRMFDAYFAMNQREGVSPEERAKINLYMRQSLERMKSLIEGMRQIITIAKGKQPCEVINMEEVLNEIALPLRGVTSPRPFRLTTQKLVPVFGMRSLVTQVVSNLIDNAMKYNHHDVAQVVINSRKFAAGTVFCVADNGIGIPLEGQKKVFTFGERLNPSSEIEGTGVGLATCKRIMELHRGRIWLRSKPGVGTKFYLFFPDKAGD